MFKKNRPTLDKSEGASIKKHRPTLTAPIRRSAPLDPDEPTAAERSVEEELDELQAGFRERNSQEQARFVQATDSEYWVAVCFQTREQKEEFLQKLGLLELGDKYLDGLEVAQALGIEIESPTPPMPRFQIDRKLKSLARKL